MLDLYKISDHIDGVGVPVESDYLDGFTLEEFKEFEEVVAFARANDIALEFFSDFRLTATQVRTVLSFIEKNRSRLMEETASSIRKSVYDRLEMVLRTCAGLDTGMTAFCD